MKLDGYNFEMLFFKHNIEDGSALSDKQHAQKWRSMLFLSEN